MLHKTWLSFLAVGIALAGIGGRDLYDAIFPKQIAIVAYTKDFFKKMDKMPGNTSESIDISKGKYCYSFKKVSYCFEEELKAADADQNRAVTKAEWTAYLSTQIDKNADGMIAETKESKLADN